VQVSSSRYRSRLVALGAAVVVSTAVIPAAAAAPPVVNSFVRLATFDVTGRVAEIVAATPDGTTLIYTDSIEDEIGFVDITNPAAPVADGELGVGGSPTSVAVSTDGAYALVAVDTSPADTATSLPTRTGALLVVRLADRQVVRTIDMGGQPDSIAISPDGRFAAVAIENQRNESYVPVGGFAGGMPQNLPGFVQILELDGLPATWTTEAVALTGLPVLRFGTDPEPEFIDINAANVAAVTLQENNAVVLIDLETAAVTGSWSAGQTSHKADLVATDGTVSFTQDLTARREPDAIGWTPGGRLITANEGDYPNDSPDLRAGSRDFTVFTAAGAVAFEPGVAYEQQLARVSHYPDTRSTNKGAEPEGLEIGRYGNRTFAFVGAERAHAVVVYRIDNGETSPTFVQVLPTGLRPEGLLAIPGRGLFVTANEDDGTISIFGGRTAAATAPGAYPEVFAASAPPTGPVWGALSGLSALDDRPLVAVTDSFYRPSHVLTLDLGSRIEVTASLDVTKGGAAQNYDLEGIAHRPQGGYWVASEGARVFNPTTGAPLASPIRNLLVRIDAAGVVQEEIRLPAEIEANQARFGFEGVATSADGSQVYVAFQREWNDPFEEFSPGLVPGNADTADPVGYVRIGRYTPATGLWAFWRYPLDTLTGAPSGSWVGLSEIVRVDDTTFGVIERDNLKDDAVQVKRLYTFSIDGLAPAAPGATTVPVVAKSLARDLVISDGQRLEKLEGMTILPNRSVLVVTDNDGFGETQVHRFGRVLD
jgi:DNA-binding beta-propeller fold protein YncE